MRRTRCGRMSKPTISVPSLDGKTIPDVLDEIVVLWTVDGRDCWWDATVLDSNELNSSPVIGNGIIEYSARLGYEKETNTVEFLTSEEHPRLIRHSDSNSSCYDTMSWEFSSVQRNSEMEASSTTPHLSSNSGGNAELRQSISTSTPPNIIMPANVDIVGRSCDMRACEIIFLHLKHDMLRKMGPKWPFHRDVWSTNAEGMFPGSIQVSTACDLQSMRLMASIITNSIGEENCFAIPSFPDLPTCSLAISEISIYLRDLKSVFKILRLRDIQDYKQALYQVTRGQNGSVVQVMGCAGQEDTGTVTNVKLNRLILGGSVLLRRSFRRQDDGEMEKEWSTVFSMKGNNVVQQTQDDFDIASQAFLAPWRLLSSYEVENVGFPFSMAGVNRNITDYTSFRLSWTPIPAPSSRKWSSDALNNNGEVLGYVTLTLPTVACTGSHTTNAILALLKELVDQPDWRL